jgi:hypothetical protein
MKILLGDSNTKVGREDIFKQTFGNENLHEISNDNVVISNFFYRSPFYQSLNCMKFSVYMLPIVFVLTLCELCSFKPNKINTFQNCFIL